MAQLKLVRDEASKSGCFCLGLFWRFWFSSVGLLLVGVVFFPRLPFIRVMLFPSFVLGNASAEGSVPLALLSPFFFSLSFLPLLFSFLPLLLFSPFFLPPSSAFPSFWPFFIYFHLIFLSFFFILSFPFVVFFFFFLPKLLPSLFFFSSFPPSFHSVFLFCPFLFFFLIIPFFFLFFF